MSDPLAILEEERDNILLAEIGAMIHNLGKMSEEHLINLDVNAHLYFGDFLYDLLNLPQNQAKKTDPFWEKHWNYAERLQGKFYLAGIKHLLKALKICFPPEVIALSDREYELREFSSFRMRPLYDNNENSNKPRLDELLGNPSHLGRLLAEAHGRAVGGDKGFVLGEIQSNQQNPLLMHLSTAFGIETENIAKRNIAIEQSCLLLNLQNVLRKIDDFLYGKTKQTSEEFWKTIHHEFHAIFQKSLRLYIADTRQPVNDLDLYGFHHAAASFFKAGIAKVLLEQPAKLEYKNIDGFQWRLLSIRYNGLGYIMQARGINDMLGKQTALNNTLNEVKGFLEVERPIANEIYRDENGTVFLFPDIEEQNEAVNAVKNAIQEKFRRQLAADLKPDTSLSEPSRQALELGKLIAERTPKFCQFYSELQVNQPTIQIDGKTKTVDLCQSCNLRFIGQGLEDTDQETARKKAFSRKLCGVCYTRRNDRARNWWEQERHKTIWLDEVADEHGQVALIVGKFGLEHWLDGWRLNSFLVKTFREIIEKSPSLFTDYKKALQTSIANRTVQRYFGKHANNSALKNDLQTTKDQINSIIDALHVNNINTKDIQALIESIEKAIKSLKSHFMSTIGIDISYELEFLRIGKFLENTLSTFGSLSAYTEVPLKEFKDLNGFDSYIKEEKDFWKIFQENNTHRFLFLNAKSPSFARISRIWQQTKAFNQAIPGWFEVCFQAHKCPRLFIKAIDKDNEAKKDKFKTTHIYEFTLGGADVSLYCVKGSEKDNTDLQFVSATNLGYLQEAFHLDLAACINKDKPEATDKDEKLKAQFTSAEPDKQSYFPYIDILAEPQMFMLLVPAAQAIEVTNLIKARYDEEFSKVKNRLPLNIGVVFAKRRQPLYTMIEAGRKMLDGFENMPEKQPEESEKQPVLWKIAKDVETVPGKPQRFKLTFEHAKRSGRDNEGYMRQLEWEVSAELGDPSKTDYYYPYFYTNFTEEKDVQGRVNIFKAPLTKDDSDWHYLCHVSELKKDDEVYVTPSLFDFEFLEVPGRRFDLYYEHNMRTRDHQHSRPFLLDDIKQLQRVWELLTRKGMTNAKFRGLLEVIEKQRESWFGAAHLADSVGDESFKKFVEYTFWTQAKAWYGELSSDDRALILRYAVNGRLADVSELFMKILKQSIEEE